jgi:hypothetical protein
MRNIALRVSSLFALGVLGSLLCVSSEAVAGDVTLSVLGLEPAAGAPENIASALTEALRQRVSSSTNYRLVPGKDLVEVKLVFSCPDEAPLCMTQAAQSIGSTKIIFGNVQPVGTDAYLVTLKLLDAERGTVESWISEQITKSQTAPINLRTPVQKWFATLTGQALPATLKVTGGVIGASVWIDGTQAGLIGNDGLTLSSVATGHHKLTVSKTGYEKWDRSVTLVSGAIEKVAVQLKAIEKPGAVPPEAQHVATTPPTPSGGEPEAMNQGSRIAAWALLGVGLVSVGLGVYSSVKVGDINSKLDQYRRYPCASDQTLRCSADGKTNIGYLSDKPGGVDYVNDQKNKGDTYSTLQWVGYSVGGAMLVASGIFMYYGYFSEPTTVAARRSRHNLIVLPSIAPNSVGALAHLAF